MSYSVGMSVEPWIDAWPRSAMIAAARPPDVAEQQLQDRGRADDLHAVECCVQSDRVADRAGLARGPERDVKRVGDLEEALLRDAADLLDHLRRVAREMPLQDLKDAARMLQRRVAPRARRRRVEPRTATSARVVGCCVRHPSRRTARPVLGVLEVRRARSIAAFV